MEISSRQNLYQPQISFSSKTACITTEHLVELLNSGKTVRQIKAELNIANDTFYKLLDERGIAYKKQKVTVSNTLKDKISEFLAQGLTVPEICGRLNITAFRYYSIVKNAGIQHPRTAKVVNAAKITAEQLKEKINSGLSVSDICEFFGISSSAYYSLLKAFKIPSAVKEVAVRNASITKEQLLELIKSGKSMKEILKELGINETAYSSLISKYGIMTESKLHKQKISAITRDTLLKLVNERIPVKEICERLDIPVRTYSRLLDKFGIMTDRKTSKIRLKSIKAEDLQAAVDSGMSRDAICRRFNIREDAFYKLLKRLNIRYEYKHHFGEVVIPRAKLEEFASSKKPMTEVTEVLGVAVNTYHEKARLAKVKTALRDSIDCVDSIPKEKIQALLTSGKSVDEICKILKITRANYVTLLRKHNLETATRKSREVNSSVSKELLIELRKIGKSVAEICKELNISKSSYQRLINEDSKIS